MKILLFTKGNRNVASSRHRAYYVSEELSKQGYKTQVINLKQFDRLSLSPSRFEQIKEVWLYLINLSAEDVVMVQRVHNPPEFLALWIIGKQFKKYKVIYDIDDATYLYWPLSTRLGIWLADTVFTGSHHLYQYCKKLNKHTHLIPTSVQLENYSTKQDYKITKTPVIGWIGHGPSHRENLRKLVPVLKELDKQREKLIFRIIGSKKDKEITKMFLGLTHIQIETIDELDWKDPTAGAKEIAKFDIGVMPLEDNEFNRAKCAFKAIEYMACAVPTVASSLGENGHLIHDRENGFLAANCRQWIEAINILLKSESVRKETGTKGRRTVASQYALSHVITNIKKVLNHVTQS